jgi:hypothetical protein
VSTLENDFDRKDRTWELVAVRSGATTPHSGDIPGAMTLEYVIQVGRDATKTRRLGCLRVLAVAVALLQDDASTQALEVKLIKGTTRL